MNPLTKTGAGSSVNVSDSRASRWRRPTRVERAMSSSDMPFASRSPRRYGPRELMNTSRAVYALGRRKVKARGYLRVGQLDGNEAGEPWLLHGDAVENIGGFHGLSVVGNDDELGLGAELAQHPDEPVDIRVVERRIDLIEDAEGARTVVEDRKGQRQSGEGTIST